jgi:hypothetical protein
MFDFLTILFVFVLQQFVDLLIMRFRNIDPNKDGKSIASATDLKHEIQIITLRNSIFEKFKDFLEAHTLGNLIDPDTAKKYRESKSWFDSKKYHVNRESRSLVGFRMAISMRCSLSS